MDFNVMLNVNLDAFGLSTSGGVTVRDLDGDLLHMEAYSWAPERSLSQSLALLSEHAHELVADLPTQLSLLSE